MMRAYWTYIGAPSGKQALIPEFDDEGTFFLPHVWSELAPYEHWGRSPRHETRAYKESRCATEQEWRDKTWDSTSYSDLEGHVLGSIRTIPASELPKSTILDAIQSAYEENHPSFHNSLVLRFGKAEE